MFLTENAYEVSQNIVLDTPARQTMKNPKYLGESGR
jgi:hypothetical protein